MRNQCLTLSAFFSKLPFLGHVVVAPRASYHVIDMKVRCLPSCLTWEPLPYSISKSHAFINKLSLPLPISTFRMVGKKVI